MPNGDVRVRPHTRYHYVRVPGDERRFAPTVIIPAADEAEEILLVQGYVVGYETEEQAYQLRNVLLARGIETEVYADVGMPAAPRSELEAREMRASGIEPGERRVRWGLRLVSASL